MKDIRQADIEEQELQAKLKQLLIQIRVSTIDLVNDTDKFESIQPELNEDDVQAEI